MNAFQELGEMAAESWKKHNEDPAAFPEIATRSLRDSGVLGTVEMSHIVEWLGTAKNLPLQHAKDFGQPPINVFVADKFYIQVLFWIDATTAVHEHSFAGAFGVLCGSSVHSRYKFELTNDLSKEFKLGHVDLVSAEILRKGDICTIAPGGSFIHALFHMDRPSISVVVRTNSVPTAQFAYIKPHVAFDPFHEDNVLKVRTRLLESLRFSDHDMFWKYANLLLRDASYSTLFNVLSVAHNQSRNGSGRWQMLLDECTTKYGNEVIEPMLSSIREEERTTKLTKLRRTVHETAHRFFLALLLNLPSRDMLLKFVSQEFHTHNPEVLIAQWIKEMGDQGLILSRREPRLLDMIVLAVRCNSFEEVERRLQGGGGSGFNGSREEMKSLWDAARGIDLFQPLFKAA